MPGAALPVRNHNGHPASLAADDLDRHGEQRHLLEGLADIVGTVKPARYSEQRRQIAMPGAALPARHHDGHLNGMAPAEQRHLLAMPGAALPARWVLLVLLV